MITQVAVKFAHKCKELRLIKAENEQIVIFGMEQIIFFLVNFLVMLGIGILTSGVYQTIIYFVCYISLSGLTGSYHAKNRLNCSIKTVFVFCIYILTTKYTPSNAYILLSIIYQILYFFIVGKVAPVEHKNVSYSDDEICRKRQKLWLRSVVYVCISMVLVLGTTLYQYLYSISTSLLIIALFALAGYLFNEK